MRNDLSVSVDTLSGLVGQQITHLVVDRNDHIYLADRSQHKIHVISPEGRYLDSIGKQGRGPGEFERNFKSVSIYNDTLYVVENDPSRFSVFRLDNRQLIRMQYFPDVTIDEDRIGAPELLYPMANGAYQMVFPNYRMARYGITYDHVTFSIFDYDLEPVDKVVRTFPPTQYFVYTDPQTGGEAIFGNFGEGLVPETLVDFDSQGNLYVAQSDSMHIRVFDPAGSKIREISYDYIPPPLTQGDVDSIASIFSAPHAKQFFYDAIEQNNVQVPGHWMAMQTLLIDDRDRIWVELINPGEKKHTWWVFGKDGKPKWQFQLSRHIQVYVVRNYKIYGIWSKEGEYPRIVRYHVEGI
ncbi:MAG: 6-bladed beta-propeller [Balneolaceae bacterium]